MSEDDSEAAHGVDSLGVQAVAGGTSALAGYLLGGADGALIGAAATPYLTAVLSRARDEVFADRRRRADEMLEAAAEAAEMTADELADASTKSEDTRFLADAAIRAATETIWPPAVRALGRALAAGLVADDDTIIDIPKMVLPAMTEMGSPHVQMMELLVMYRWTSGPQRIDSGNGYLANTRSEWTARQIIAARPTLEPVLGAVTGTLDRYGLIRQNDRTAEALARYSKQLETDFSQANRSSGGKPLTRVNPPRGMVKMQASRLAPQQTWSPTSLGEQVLKYYEQAGAVDDQASLDHLNARPGLTVERCVQMVSLPTPHPSAHHRRNRSTVKAPYAQDLGACPLVGFGFGIVSQLGGDLPDLFV